MSQGESIPGQTLGGMQFWTDHFIHGEWRIQQHAVMGHCRLLDSKNVRRGGGAFGECRARFDGLRAEFKIPALKKTCVVVLHGLGRTRGAMQGLADYLAEKGDWSVVNFSYASTRKSVKDHAAALESVISQLEGVEEIHLVGHSLGTIVIRHWLGDRERREAGVSRDGTVRNADERKPGVRRVVMLAPPSQGSAVARVLGETKLFEWILGASGQELGVAWEELQKQLAIPKELGIIAGSVRDGKGGNPLIPGDDDLVVGVEETKLAGAADFLVVPAPHTFIMTREDVFEGTLRFLKEGFFVSEAKRVRLR